MARHGRPDKRSHRDLDRFPALTFGWICLWGLIVVLAFVDLVGLWTGFVTAEEADGALQAALISGVMMALGVFRLRWLVIRRRRSGRPPVGSDDSQPALTSVAPPWIRPEQRHRLPGPTSVAREPMRRLAEAEATLAELLRQLCDGSAIAEDAVAEAWRVACDAAAELRTMAAKLEAVELAVEHAPPPEQARLTDGVGRMRAQLDHGLDAYRRLVAAAGRVLIASASAPAGDELIEASESLAGLAQGLHEVSAPDQER